MDVVLTRVAKVGSITARRLVAEFVTAQNVFCQSAETLLEKGFGEHIVREIHNPIAVDKARKIIAECQRAGVRILVRGVSEDYPELLAKCKDAPHVLYQYGSLSLSKGNCISIIGTRKATSEGLANTQAIVNSLSERVSNLVVVSGLAYGIDKAAHLAALNSNVPTAAFLPGWVMNVTPAPHRALAERIVKSGGAIFSDMPQGTAVSRGSFLSRNRLIAGVSLATIVVESPSEGGSTRTALMAKGYGRELFAVPSRSGDSSGTGTNALIKYAGANLYQEADDVVEKLKDYLTKTILPSTTNKIELDRLLKNRSLTDDIYSIMEEGELYTLGDIAQSAEISVAESFEALNILEKRGVVSSICGGLYMKNRF